jgi:hypothetical protein
VCLGLATLVAVAALVAGGADEGPRNAVAEAILVVGCFAALGRRLGLRQSSTCDGSSSAQRRS